MSNLRETIMNEVRAATKDLPLAEQVYVLLEALEEALRVADEADDKIIDMGLRAAKLSGNKNVEARLLARAAKNGAKLPEWY